MFDSFRNSAIALFVVVVVGVVGFLGGGAGSTHNVQAPVSSVAMAPVFDALGWCQKTPAPTVTVDPITSPNGDRTMHAVRGQESIDFVNTINYAQTGAKFNHQIIPPGERESKEVHDTIDFFPDAQRACFGPGVTR